MISVLVADDSFFMRKLISDILNADPGIEVVGAAADGEQAVAMAKKLRPDVITMDLDMPKMNGLEATKILMAEENIRPIVVMVSAFTKEKAAETLECLHAGAFSCIMKPSGPVSVNIETVEKDLIAQVKAAAKSKGTALGLSKVRRAAPMRTLKQKDGKFPLIVIGASTGGPPVLEELFSQLQSHIDAAVLIVQHMPASFTASLAERLDKISPIKVKQAEQGEIIKPGTALVAPGNEHMLLERRKEGKDVNYLIRLTKEAPVHGLRPSIDVLMHSVAASFQGKVLAILLTGMGEDGKIGMKEIKESGGHTIVQDPATCIVDSMVDSVIEEDCADEILPPDAIATRIDAFSPAVLT